MRAQRKVLKQSSPIQRRCPFVILCVVALSGIVSQLQRGKRRLTELAVSRLSHTYRCPPFIPPFMETGMVTDPKDPENHREVTMSDEEYRDWLLALAQRYLRMPVCHPLFGANREVLPDRLSGMSSTARFARAVSDRSFRAELLSALAQELRYACLAQFASEMDKTGVLAALDELPELTFGQLRRSVIPEEDVISLRQAGVSDPEAEIALMIQHARLRLGRPHFRPSEITFSAQPELYRAADRLDAMSKYLAAPKEKPQMPDDIKKPKKLFNGIGKILNGTVTGLANFLIGTGAILAPNPAVTAGVLASSALAIGFISQRIGDLRGE
jgi:hypothetical protein